ncbi:MAG TPA: CapA family protein [Gaiellaceae bacterium]|nr:CapA family protein [Gaiellaceae bacterium]
MRLGLAGDTMLGRGVAEALTASAPESLVSPALVEIAREADLLVLNLECCISDQGRPWPDPGKPFFFRAPPEAVDLLLHLGVDCVTLANNHALDYGEEALLDTLARLRAAGIEPVGAGADVREARRPVVLEAAKRRLAVVGASDHPADFAAGPSRPGVALADFREGAPGWLADAIANVEADAVLVTPHWGPNMAPAPRPYVRAAAAALRAAGATLVAGHSAHVFHGVEEGIVYDLGDFLDDYAVDGVLRNDLGLFFLVDLDERGPTRIEALPLKLEYCHTRAAEGADAARIRSRFRQACAEFGADVEENTGRLVVRW